MIFTSILILIVAFALPSINQSLNLNLLVRISSIVLIYAGVLSINTFYIQPIGSGIGIYSGLFQVNNQFISVFTLIIRSFVLILWFSLLNKIETVKTKASEYSFLTYLGKNLTDNFTGSLILFMKSNKKIFNKKNKIFTTSNKNNNNSELKDKNYFWYSFSILLLIIFLVNLVKIFIFFNGLSSFNLKTKANRPTNNKTKE